MCSVLPPGRPWRQSRHRREAVRETRGEGGIPPLFFRLEETPMTSRREFIKTSAAIGAGLMLGGRWQPVWAYSQSQSLPKFVEPLRDVTAGGIPLAASDGVSNYATAPRRTTRSTSSSSRTSCTRTCPIRRASGAIAPATSARARTGTSAASSPRSAGRRSRSRAQQAAGDAHLPVDRTIMGSRGGQARTGDDPPARRIRALDQRRRPVLLVGP